MALAREAVAATAARDVPEPTGASFLMHCKNAEKRSCIEQASNPFAAFQPSLEICESDTISGSSELFMSGHAILSPRLIMLLLFVAGGLMRSRCLEQMTFAL